MCHESCIGKYDQLSLNIDIAWDSHVVTPRLHLLSCAESCIVYGMWQDTAVMLFVRPALLSL